MGVNSSLTSAGRRQEGGIKYVNDCGSQSGMLEIFGGDSEKEIIQAPLKSTVGCVSGSMASRKLRSYGNYPTSFKYTQLTPQLSVLDL